MLRCCSATMTRARTLARQVDPFDTLPDGEAATVRELRAEYWAKPGEANRAWHRYQTTRDRTRKPLWRVVHDEWGDQREGLQVALEKGLGFSGATALPSAEKQVGRSGPR